jgi:dGTP triphosphohydrolase
MALRPCEGDFSVDIETLSWSIAVQRLWDKRQVIIQPSSWRVAADSRFSHTVSVVRAAAAITDGLDLNTPMAWAIALGHDVAHCPFGHLGEIVLNGNLPRGLPRYDHVDVAPHLLQEVFGLDLSREVLEGITWHSLSSGVLTAKVPNEYKVVALADKVSYVIGDARDLFELLVRRTPEEYEELLNTRPFGLLQDLNELRFSLGATDSEMMSRVIAAIVEESLEAGEVRFSDSRTAKSFNALKAFLATEFYTQTDLAADTAILQRVLRELERSDNGRNPHQLFALLTDSELRHLDRVSCGRGITAEDINALQVGEFSLSEPGDYGFLQPMFVHDST